MIVSSGSEMDKTAVELYAALLKISGYETMSDWDNPFGENPIETDADILIVQGRGDENWFMDMIPDGKPTIFITTLGIPVVKQGQHVLIIKDGMDLPDAIRIQENFLK